MQLTGGGEGGTGREASCVQHLQQQQGTASRSGSIALAATNGHAHKRAKT